jgi:hypothetical protein
MGPLTFELAVAAARACMAAAGTALAECFSGGVAELVLSLVIGSPISPRVGDTRRNLVGDDGRGDEINGAGVVVDNSDVDELLENAPDPRSALLLLLYCSAFSCT